MAIVAVCQPATNQPGEPPHAGSCTRRPSRRGRRSYRRSVAAGAAAATSSSRSRRQTAAREQQASSGYGARGGRQLQPAPAACTAAAARDAASGEYATEAFSRSTQQRHHSEFRQQRRRDRRRRDHRRPHSRCHRTTATATDLLPAAAALQAIPRSSTALFAEYPISPLTPGSQTSSAHHQHRRVRAYCRSSRRGQLLQQFAQHAASSPRLDPSLQPAPGGARPSPAQSAAAANLLAGLRVAAAGKAARLPVANFSVVKELCSSQSRFYCALCFSSLLE